jgi:hypothetical protein
MRDFLVPPVKKFETLPPGDFARLEYSAIVSGSLIKYYYYAQKLGDYFWLTFPQDYYARDWPVRESEYFRLHVNPAVSSYLNPVLLETFDRFIESSAEILKLSKTSMKTIREKKIEYFFCDNDKTVKQIVGHQVKGTLDQASNDIISATLPHYHELIHLLVNIKLKELPLVTLPIIREGIAVQLGGRWGKHPSALRDLGVFLHREKIVELDSILTTKGFAANATADIAYPVAGLFSAYLYDQLGLDRYFELYLKLSGRFKTVELLTLEEIQSAMTDALAREKWTDVQADFNSYASALLVNEATAAAGASTSGKVLLETDNCLVRKDGDWLSLEFSAQGGEQLQGSLLFGHNAELDASASALFDEHFQSKELFEGYRWAIRFDANEAGLYDYATNRLIAKYIMGISAPGDYYDQAQNKVKIRFRVSLIDGALPADGDYKLLPI